MAAFLKIEKNNISKSFDQMQPGQPLFYWKITIYSSKYPEWKCTVLDNRTASINDKNCNLSTMLTATHQKLQKS